MTCLEWSPSGSVLAAAHEDGCISLRGAAALPTGHIVRHPSAVTLTWSPSRHPSRFTFPVMFGFLAATE